MTLTGRPIGFLIMTIIALLGCHHGETKRNSRTPVQVPFPPAVPHAGNINAICQNSHCRQRYPPSYFPRSGVSHLRRRGTAINRLESWYSLCCSSFSAEEEKLCCLQQAWKQALTRFCVEEFSTMTLAYNCCENTGEDRWRCFIGRLEKPDYSCVPGYTAPSTASEPGFTYDQSAC
ncbi:extracellular matrix protein 1-like [Cyprinodon tularosa]|uniref:extracellular matrix protein 1-like n=1 Tax=Cyprinodon tularosa TaxID=77115 RepID=UPI0018E25F8B|nr:extracellular matrix protein 1-like [Cyprinodon tularosa]